MKVVAEGIETAQAVNTLTDFQCDIGQGFHLCRPVLPEALMLWYDKHPVRPAATCASPPATKTLPSGFAALRAT
jgi:sensor c-di-GMP phosphodiesterase-like protein